VVLIDGIAMSAFVLDSRTSTRARPPHDAGRCDVVVMNPDGSSALMTNGYTFVSPRRSTSTATGSAWRARHPDGAPIHRPDNVLVSVSCGTSAAGHVLPAARVEHGEFSIVRGDGVGISAPDSCRATEAVGTINLEPCPYTNWIATRSIRQPGWPLGSPIRRRF
jgi:hypothetical protein